MRKAGTLSVKAVPTLRDLLPGVLHNCLTKPDWSELRVQSASTSEPRLQKFPLHCFFFRLQWRLWWIGFLWLSCLKLWQVKSGCTSEMEQSNWHPEGEVEGLSRPLEALGEDPGGQDSASSSCSDLSITTPAAQPCPNNTKSFSGLRIFGRRWVRCLSSCMNSKLQGCSKGK